MAILPCKSFPTWGRSQAFSSPLNAPLSTNPSPHDLSFLPLLNTWLSLTTWRCQAFFSLKCKAILPNLAWGRIHACFFEVYPSPAADPYNVVCTKPLQIIPFISFLYLQDVLSYFLFISIFHFFFLVSLNFLFFLLFSRNLEFFPPKVKNYSPAFGANNRRTDAPDYLLMCRTMEPGKNW